MDGFESTETSAHNDNQPLDLPAVFNLAFEIREKFSSTLAQSHAGDAKEKQEVIEIRGGLKIASLIELVRQLEEKTQGDWKQKIHSERNALIALAEEFTERYSPGSTVP